MRPRTSAAAVIALCLGAVATGCNADPTTTTESDAASPVTYAAPTTRSAPATTSPAALPTTVVPDTTAASSSVGGPDARLDPEHAAGLDGAGFAERVSASHATMIDTAVDPAERAQAGVEHQLVLRELAGRPERDEEVLATLGPVARSAVEPVVRARQFLQQRSASRPPRPLPTELPAWTIVEPEPVDTLLGYYAEAEQLTGIAWYWLAAIHLQETRMGRIQGVSSAGAVGPMQFLPTTWAACCTGDPTVTREAIIGAATYLSQSGGPDDMAAAVYQYNPNDGYVAVVTAYAESLRDEPELYSGYHAYQVFFGTSAGTVRLPVGYSEAVPIDAASYLSEHPDDAA